MLQSIHSQEVLNSALPGSRVTIYNGNTNITEQFKRMVSVMVHSKFSKPVVCNRMGSDTPSLETTIDNWKRQYKHLSKLPVLNTIMYLSKAEPDKPLFDVISGFIQLAVKLPSGSIVKVDNFNQAKRLLEEVKLLNYHL